MTGPTLLKVAIVQSGRTQRDVAAQAGLNEATLSRYVNGWHGTDATRKAIALALGRTVSELWPNTDQADDEQVAA